MQHSGAMNIELATVDSAAIDRCGYTHNNLRCVLGTDITKDVAWQSFANSWDFLPQDMYMADGGTYRRRRYSEFACRGGDAGFTLLPHVPYLQPRDINYLNGGIYRHFEPFQSDISTSKILHAIFTWCVAVLRRVSSTKKWHIQTFQNRILARDGAAGQPTPEGMHRDGVDYVLTLLMTRQSISGGTSRVYEASTKECIAEVTLAEAGEFLFADDKRLLHSVTPVTPAGSNAGHRDVLIAMFTGVDQ